MYDEPECPQGKKYGTDWRMHECSGCEHYAPCEMSVKSGPPPKTEAEEFRDFLLDLDGDLAMLADYLHGHESKLMGSIRKKVNNKRGDL